MVRLRADDVLAVRQAERVAEGANVAGLLLAGGAGRRMGGPKALVRGADGTAWVVRAAYELRDAGCHPVCVVVGAAADEALALLAEAAGNSSGWLQPVVATDWDEGMGASLRVGVDRLATEAPAAEALLVHLVDLPDVGAEVLARVLSHAGPAVLARATYAGTPGHPVLLGREHWPAIASSAGGDEGARAYLAGRHVREIECGDLASGTDVDSR